MNPISPSTRLLAIDTGTSYLSLGVSAHGQNHVVYEAAGTQQSAQILPAIRRLLADAGTQLHDLDAIVYAQGPGAFTGLRIGLSVAEGLAAALSLPLIGVPSLDAVAAVAPRHPYVLAAVDARMGEWFYAWFDTTGSLPRRLSNDAVAPPQAIALPEHLSGSLSDFAAQAVGVGNAFALGIPFPVVGSSTMPTADTFLTLAQSGQYAATDAAQAALHYVRNNVALTAAEQAQRRAQKAGHA